MIGRHQRHSLAVGRVMINVAGRSVSPFRKSMVKSRFCLSVSQRYHSLYTIHDLTRYIPLWISSVESSLYFVSFCSLDQYINKQRLEAIFSICIIHVCDCRSSESHNDKEERESISRRYLNILRGISINGKRRMW